MSRFLDLISGKQETAVPVVELEPVEKVSAKKPKIDKVAKKAPKHSEDKK
jgi:hypothetical protein